MGERVFFARLAVSIVCIVLCMGAMGFSAYAYFTASVSSNMNQIQAANFDLNVQKIEPQTKTSSASYESEKIYTLQSGVYDFVLEMSDNATATTGYCQIVIIKSDGTNGESVYTQQFGKIEEQKEPVRARTIRIQVATDTKVKFVPCWGTYSGQGFNEVVDKIVVTGDFTTNVKPWDSKGTSDSTIGTSESDIANESTSTDIPETGETANTMQETNSTEAIVPMENKAPEEIVTPGEPTISTETTTPEELTNTSENIVTPTEEKKDETSSNETESDKVKSDELTEDITTSTNPTE